MIGKDRVNRNHGNYGLNQRNYEASDRGINENVHELSKKADPGGLPFIRIVHAGT